MNRLRLGLILMVSVIAVPSIAFAGTQSKDPASEACQADIDTCFHEGDWWYTSLYYQNGSTHTHTDCYLSEGCKVCGVTSQGAPVCAKAGVSAACTCELVHVDGAGPNIVECSAQGTCTFRN